MLNINLGICSLNETSANIPSQGIEIPAGIDMIKDIMLLAADNPIVKKSINDILIYRALLLTHNKLYNHYSMMNIREKSGKKYSSNQPANEACGLYYKEKDLNRIYIAVDDVYKKILGYRRKDNSSSIMTSMVIDNEVILVKVRETVRNLITPQSEGEDEHKHNMRLDPDIINRIEKYLINKQNNDKRFLIRVHTTNRIEYQNNIYKKILLSIYDKEEIVKYLLVCDNVIFNNDNDMGIRFVKIIDKEEIIKNIKGTIFKKFINKNIKDILSLMT